MACAHCGADGGVPSGPNYDGVRACEPSTLDTGANKCAHAARESPRARGDQSLLPIVTRQHRLALAVIHRRLGRKVHPKADHSAPARRTIRADQASSLGPSWLRQLLKIEGPLKYLDLNFCWGKGYGVSAGIIFNIESETIHVYGGPALAFGSALSLTGSSQSVTPGWNLGLQASAFRGSVQAGLDPSGRTFREYGWQFVGSGASLSGTWISPPITTPASQWDLFGDLVRPWKEVVFK